MITAMKHTISYTAIALALLASACVNDDERFGDNGVGRVALSAEIKSDVRVVSRAATDEDYLNQSLIFWISNAKGPVRKYQGAENLPQSEWLVTDRYLAEAWAGDSVSASFDKRWFKGQKQFEVLAGETVNVAVECKIANVLVETAYADDLQGLLSDVSLTVGHKRGSLVYEGTDAKVGYFMMPSTDKDLAWTLSALNPDGSKIEKSGVIASAKPATKYILTVHANPDSEVIGGAYFDIVVDTREEVVDDDIVIELPPVISGFDFNAAEEQLFRTGQVGRKSMFITASTAITEASLTVAGLSDLLHVAGEKFDDVHFIASSSAEYLHTYRDHGVDALYEYDADEDVASLKINFEEEFTNALPEGAYDFVFYVKDAMDRESTLTLKVLVSNDPISLNAANDFDIWATKATLTATALRADFGTPSFEYRKAGDTAWSSIAATVNGSDISAELTELTPGTSYQYRVVNDNDFASSPLSFTTESPLQIPNAGFEDWNTDSKAWLLCTDASSMFWDSGNHGSAKMNKNITTPDSELKHSGNYSIKMTSQFVGLGTIGKFAAGNAFVGQYLATEGTDGQLGWGRPFASRPKALKGYVKYTPEAITDADAASGKKKGEMDEGMIYIAILDGSTVEADAADKDYVSGVSQKTWPVIIKTKASKRTLFDPNGANVIAYGEKVFTTATAGDGLVEFEIPLDYHRTDIKAVNIMITMSASRYGDYFTGGPSVMNVDDLQLVY